jgi:hypothetical protein
MTTRIRVGLVADPASPTEIARLLSDLEPPDGGDGGDGGDGEDWNIEIVSEPFTMDSEDVETALARLRDHARQHEWEIVIGLTELPFRDGDEGRYLLAETDPQQRTAVISLPALGGFGMRTRARHAVRTLIRGMATDTEARNREPMPHFTSRWRLLVGMALANRPWLLVPGLKSALVAALATGAIATINSTVWLLAGSLSPWRLIVATIASIALVVAWLVIDGEFGTAPTTVLRTPGKGPASTTPQH